MGSNSWPKVPGPPVGSTVAAGCPATTLSPTARWIIADREPDVIATSALDGSGTCANALARVADGSSTLPPMGNTTWDFACVGGTWESACEAAGTAAAAGRPLW